MWLERNQRIIPKDLSLPVEYIWDTKIYPYIYLPMYMYIYFFFYDHFTINGKTFLIPTIPSRFLYLSLLSKLTLFITSGGKKEKKQYRFSIEEGYTNANQPWNTNKLHFLNANHETDASFFIC